MRRARFQIKPNLGPRAAAPPQPATDNVSKPKPAPLTAALQQPTQSATTAAEDAKADSFTQLKSPDNKSADSAVSSPTVHTAAVRSLHFTTDTAVSNKTTAQAPKSPRKSAGSDQVKVSSNPLVVTQSKTGAASGFTHISSSGKLQSPRKSVSSDHPKTPTKSGGDTPSSIIVDTETSKVLGHGPPGSPVKKKAPAPAVKPVVRGIRSRFAKVKVRPNLAEAGRRGPKPPVAEKKGPEPEDTAQGQQESKGEDRGTEGRAEPKVSSQEDDAVVSSQALELDHIREDQGDDEVDQPQTSVADHPTETLPDHPKEKLPADTVGSEEDAEDSDAETASKVSADRDAADGLSEAVSESDQFAVPEECRKAAEEKKWRRAKPDLPSSSSQADRGRMKMSDLIYWNPARNHMKQKEKNIPQTSVSNTNTNSSAPAKQVDSASDVASDDEASNHSDGMPVPQLKIGPDGNIILNLDSLVMENSDQAGTEVPMEVIEEDDDRFITCNSFRDHRHQKRWTQKETARFFKALSMVGTDFSLMCGLFPSRSRRDLKNKFSKEEKRNRPLIDKALRERQGFDKTTFEKAKEEEEVEKRRQKAMEAGRKQRKKNVKHEKEAAELEEEEEDEEALERRILTEEQEERKENSLKRRNKKLAQDGRDFSPFKKARRQQRPAGDAEEVVEILMSMSRGKMAANRQGEDDDDMSDTTSVASDNNIFVPRIARRRAAPRLPCSSSENVVIDSEVPVPELVVQEGDGGEASSYLSQTFVQDIPTNVSDLNQPVPAGMAEEIVVENPDNAASVTASQNVGGELNPDLTSSGVVQSGAVTNDATSALASSSLPSASLVDVSSFIEGLRSQTSAPVDVVLVEQRIEGQQQGLVHVYLVPRTGAQAEGGGENGVQREGVENNGVGHVETVSSSEVVVIDDETVTTHSEQNSSAQDCS